MIGKGNQPDFAMRWNTFSSEGGWTKNPRDLSASAGGSSGGDAAAVAANADVIIIVARTDSGLSLFLAESNLDGYESGPPLNKIGQRGQTTTELLLDDVKVGSEALLGEEGRGLEMLKSHLPLERLSIAGFALAAAGAAHDWTREHVRNRTAFGRRLADFQNKRMVMAEMGAKLNVTRAWVERAVIAFDEGELSSQDVAQAKWRTTELQQRVITRCLQLHGGYGYMRDQPIRSSAPGCPRPDDLRGRD